MFQDLQDDESKSAVDFDFEMKEAFKLVSKKLNSEGAKPRERGVQRVPIDYQLTQGGSVVIIADNEWRGTSATVVQPNPKFENGVLVIRSVLKWTDPLFQQNGNSHDDTPIHTKPLIIKQSDLAVWEMDSVWDDFDKAKSPIMSLRESSH